MSMRVAAPALRNFIASLFERAGMPAAHAATVADALVWANLRGVDTHGVSRVPRYLEFIETGIINPKPQMRVTTDTPAVQVLEADRAAGAVAIFYFTERIARGGMTGLAITASIPNMAYHGARAAGVSTAPISIAVPGAGDTPIVFDMGTGVVSLGRLAQAKRANETLAAGIALDAQGQPTTDAQAATIPLPLGGAKGSGLALMIEMMSSIAVGNPLLAEFFSGEPDAKRHRQNALVIAIDAFRFCPEEQFRGDPAALKALPADPQAGGILVPGERGYIEAERRGRNGIPLPPGVANELVAAATKLGLAAPWME